MRAAILGVVLVLLGVGCGSGSKAPARKYTSVPVAQPMFQVIPANVDPNTARIPGAPGNIVQNAQPDGRSWALDSTRVWQAFPGSGGGGTVSSATAPLSIADGGVMQIATATAADGGYMSATDKAKLDSFAPGSWFDTQAKICQAKLPALTKCDGIHAGATPNGGNTTLVTGNCSDGNVEGGGCISASGAPTELSRLTVYQTPKTASFCVVFHAKFTAIDATVKSIGLIDPTNSQSIQFAAGTALDATHFVISLQNGSTANTALSVFDSGWHDDMLTFDTTTLTAWIDNANVGSTTTLTRMTTLAVMPYTFNGTPTTSKAIVTDALWCYAPPA